MIAVFHGPGNRRMLGCNAVPSTLLLLVEAQPAVRSKISVTLGLLSEFTLAFSTKMSVCCGRNSPFCCLPLLACSGRARFIAIIQLSHFDFCTIDAYYYRLSICMFSVSFCPVWELSFCFCFSFYVPIPKSLCYLKNEPINEGQALGCSDLSM